MSLYGPRVNGGVPGGSRASGASSGAYSGLTSIPDSVSRRSTAVTAGYATWRARHGEALRRTPRAGGLVAEGDRRGDGRRRGGGGRPAARARRAPRAPR